MFIKIDGKISTSDLHNVVDILSSYFQKHRVEEFINVDIDLKPFSKEIKLPICLFSETGREIKSLEIGKSKSGELKLTEITVNNSWISSPLGSFSPGELMMKIWPLCVLGTALLIVYLIWFKA